MAESPPPPPTMEAEKPHDTSPSTIEAGNPPPSKHLRLIRWLTIPEIEERGIQRVLPSDSNPIPAPLTYIQPFLFWFSINLAAVNITLGMLGPLLFSLSFTDSSLCAVFGSILGSSAVAYISTFGPESGVRTMVFARFTMGWWPAKLVVLLNIIVMLGYSMIDCVVAGQILSAVSKEGSLDVRVGIVIVSFIAWGITTYGIRMFHFYERYAGIPQIIVVVILYIVSAKNFDTSSISQGDPQTVIGNKLSFFSLCLSAAITYSGQAADYFVYYSPSTQKIPLFVSCLFGLVTSFTLALVVGIGLASGISTVPSYETAVSISQGALIVAGFEPLGTFGSFCGTVIALGLIANLILPTYSSGIDFQVFSRKATKISRWVWNTIGVLIYTICALAGRDHFSEIFQNFLTLMGYWVAIWIAITIEEHIFFRRRNWKWEVWEKQELLPIGIAAMIAFLVGWMGAILSMAQFWYTGPLAKMVGDHGADMGNYMGFALAAAVYPPIRILELGKFDR